MAYVKTYLKREIVIDSIITLHYFEYMKDVVFDGESHNFWEFLYVDKGTVSVTAGSNNLILHAGDIVFHKPDEFHAFESIGSTPPNLVVFSFVCFSTAMQFFRNKSFTLKTEERELISHIIIEGKQTLRTPINVPSVEQVLLKSDAPFASQQLILLYLELFLITLYRNHSGSVLVRNASPKTSAGSRNTRDALFSQIIQYMDANICETLTVSGICDVFSISRSTLHALFYSRHKCGPIDYFNGMKIQKAKEIIRNGTMNFTEIAYYLSFSSLPYFSKRFKQITGMSPGRYASSIKGMSDALQKQ